MKSKLLTLGMAAIIFAYSFSGFTAGHSHGHYVYEPVTLFDLTHNCLC